MIRAVSAFSREKERERETTGYHFLQNFAFNENGDVAVNQLIAIISFPRELRSVISDRDSVKSY